MNLRPLLMTTVLVALGCAGAAHAALTIAVAPVVGSFGAVEISGTGPQTVTTSIGNWRVDATATLTGWHVDVAATQLRTSEGDTLPLQSLRYAAPTVSGASGQLLALYPSILLTRATPAPIDLSANGGTTVAVASAVLNTGGGVWNFTQGSSDLRLTVPVDAKAGTYTSTITFTLSPGPL